MKDHQLKYSGTIKYNDTIVHRFQTIDLLQAIAQIASLIAEEFPHAKGELIDLNSNHVVFECQQRPIC